MANDQSIETLKGIGEKTAKLFEKVGIRTIDDLLHYYPRGYDTYGEPKAIGELSEDETGTVEGFLKSGATGVHVNGLSIVQATISDMTGKLRLVWYHMPYLKNTLRPDSHFIFRGRVIRKKNGLTMEQPQMFKPEAYEELLSSMRPVYAQTKGLGNKMITSAVEQALAFRTLERDYLPAGLRIANELAEYNFAIEHIHFPSNEEELKFARKRLVYDEFFFFLLAVRHLKEKRQNVQSPFHMEKQDECRKLLADLPYRLTNAQLRTLEEVLRDLKSGSVMNRLIQGDVGSGKTIIAVLALLAACENGYQGALMVPTEVLARQHFESVTELFEKHGVDKKVILLTGSMTAKEKRIAYEKVASHEADIIIGTHALIQEKIVYDNLALVITDEQHRFGVAQREMFGNKGQMPHVLVMSATPIPRTLAIILYGDLDISVIDELPANRLPIKNCVVDKSYRPRAYRFIENEVKNGRQAYVICPMVEESEMIDAENVLDYTKILRQNLPGIRVEYLHGKMKGKEKNKIMEEFAAGEIQVLVSTTVIEVGVNVPNATVMMIENAERFGLAQLHQLRGRVGRGDKQSYCIMVNASGNKEKNRRLDVLNKSNDGFYIASEDLKLRGPGDIFGIRQSGDLEFQLADIYTDAVTLKKVSEDVNRLLEQDENLEQEENQELKKRLDRFLEEKYEKLNL
ncbi:MAG: ATP-dependent DNA helicase RecG [Candidatus Copromonas sp.]|uniref:ATP-dependent DNA helicase RecG n=1 Tax=Clostridiaceae TaxID=31979 RepID=UPI0001CE5FF9|nr:ATP-dependent DNA helicase RecG [Clostridium sp. MCC328]MBS5373489.1 ATP-dependent DNA helicase RecG [butyrate-producing bacterium]MBT9820602.1 ATP-dependent DNA helicase RecG [Clostridium sp. MCC328]MDR3829230.1 ATP-dependent DNA helicase RecG [Candidatus Copromonas sp.]CBL42327.1 ATP-dependent DNA helicase RecG [butyrate-producing bacterium SS3/4]